LLAMVAPRALMVISATRDAFQFSVGEAKKSIAAAEPVFKLFDKPKNIHHAIFESGHDYSKVMRETMYGWMTQQLKGKGDGSPIAEPPLDVQDPERIRCFPGDSRPAEWLTLPQFAAREGRALLASWQPPATDVDWERRATEMRTTLIERTLGGLPVPAQVDFERLEVQDTNAATETRWTFVPEPGLELNAVCEHSSGGPDRTAVLLNLEGVAAARQSPLADALRTDGWNVVTLDLRATGARAWPNDTIMRSQDHNTAQWAMWIGRPLLGQWTNDVLRLVDTLELAIGGGVGPVTIIGQGPAGLVALCAAAADDRQKIAQVATVGTLVSFISDMPYEGQRVGIMAPGILRDVGDIPCLAALALPRRVVIAGGVTGGGQVLDDPQLRSAFEATKQLADLSGRADALTIVPDASRLVSSLGSGN
jgi:hypothetical protein